MARDFPNLNKVVFAFLAVVLSGAVAEAAPIPIDAVTSFTGGTGYGVECLR